MKLNYSEFKEYVVNNIGHKLNPDVYTPSETTVTLISITKLNDEVRDGVQIKSGEQGPIPILYLDDYYSIYVNDRASLEELLNKMGNILNDHRTESFDMDFSKLNDWNYAKHYIKARIVNKTYNQAYNADKIWHECSELSDLVFIYYLQLTSDSKTTGTITITKQLFSNWNISMIDLHNIAIVNTMESDPLEFQTLFNMLADLGGDVGEHADETIESYMYVLTTSSHMWGAIGLLFPNTLDTIYRHINSNFFILPSSIHEFIIAKDDGHIGAYALKDMVKTINMTEVDADEKLSDNVYYYDGNKVSIL